MEIPPGQVQGAAIPEPPSVASSLPKSFVAPVEPPRFRSVLDAALSEGSENFSMSSGHSIMSITSDDAPGAKPTYIKYRSDGLVEAATLPSLVERLVYDSTGMSFRYER
jgi:hypothetical protein